jgi:hypothetical protein
MVGRAYTVDDNFDFPSQFTILELEFCKSDLQLRV